MVLLDRFLPYADVRERHMLEVAAPPARVLAAARSLTPRDVPLLVVLMALRTLPELLRRRASFGLGRPLLDEFRRSGFVLLADAEDELVLGGAGRFWRLDGDIRRLAPEQFEDFADPGTVKAAFNFRVEPHAGGTLLSTETRVLASDDEARRSFRRYWRVIYPGSAAIRIAWLRAIRRRALR